MTVNTIHIAGNNDDCFGYKGDTPDYSTIASRPYVDETSAASGTNPYCERSKGTTDFYIVNAYFRFDCSPVPDDEIITAATLDIYPILVQNPDSLSLMADWYDFGGSPSDTSDWEHSSSGNAHAGTPLSSITAGVVNSFALLNPDDNINKKGYTGLRLCISMRAADAAPTGSNGLRPIAGYEDASLPEATLTVTSSSQKLRPDADIALGGWSPA